MKSFCLHFCRVLWGLRGDYVGISHLRRVFGSLNLQLVSRQVSCGHAALLPSPAASESPRGTSLTCTDWWKNGVQFSQLDSHAFKALGLGYCLCPAIPVSATSQQASFLWPGCSTNIPSFIRGPQRPRLYQNQLKEGHQQSVIRQDSCDQATPPQNSEESEAT